MFGPRDVVDLEAIGALGLPYWLAGSYGGPERVQRALDAGAAGVQVGTAFAFCEESGLRADLRERVVQLSRDGKLDVFTDPQASPTGFPFKVLQLEGSLSDRSVYEQRERVCDLGFLRQGYCREDGSIGWRCPGERVAAYLHKGGEIEETEGRKCLCNGLLANVGLGQVRGEGEYEQPILTSGDDVSQIAQFLPSDDATSYTAADVVAHLLSGIVTPAAGLAERCRMADP